MGLSKIRLANKKAKHNRRRREAHQKFSKHAENIKIRRKRMHKIMIQGRREHNVFEQEKAARGETVNG